MKYIVVLGGSISGIGKGKLSSSIGLILQSYGYMISFLKIDPYLNYDASKMQPSANGETYVVLRDGTEGDLDLGNYERFCDLILTKNNVITSGQILYNIIDSERKGDHNGGTLRFATSYFDYLYNHIMKVSNKDVCMLTHGKLIQKNRHC